MSNLNTASATAPSPSCPSGTQARPSNNQTRKDTLLKLLQIEPDHLSSLVQATGWGEQQTRMTLMQLTVDGLVSHHNMGGRRVYKICGAGVGAQARTAPAESQS